MAAQRRLRGLGYRVGADVNGKNTTGPVRTILLADDEGPLRELVRATLGSTYRLLEAVDGLEALALARSELPDLVLLDVKMPRLDGFTVCEQLKTDPATSHIPVLMLTAWASQEDQRRGAEAGADGYLTKPFSPSVLLDTVDRVVAGTRPRPQPRPATTTPEEPTAFSPDIAQTLAYARELRTLYEAARDQAARFRFLVEMGRDLVGSTSLDALLQLALERAISFAGYDGGSVLLLAGPEGPLEVRASAGADAARPGTLVHDLNSSVAGRTLKQLRPLVLEGRGDAVGTNWRRYTRPIPSSICLPLITPGNHPIGVLALKSATRVRRLDTHDIDALQLLAAQLAAAIESTRLRERIQRSLDALLGIYQAGQVLGSSLEMEEVGKQILDIARRVSGLEAGAISLLDPRRRLRVWRTTGQEEVWRRAQRTYTVRHARQTALASGQPQYFLLKGRSRQSTSLAGWCLPLRMHDQVIGVLEAYGPTILAQAAPVEVLGSLANQAASALENARLYRELAQRERQLHELVGRLLAAQEEERRRVAYEIHDGLAQVAASAHQHLQAYARRHRPRSPQARQELERTLELAQRAVREARRVIAGLRPTALDDLGLAPATRLEIEALAAEGWQITYEESLGQDRLPAEVETTLFRVVQEALTNVRKHAQTNRAHVSLRRRGQVVRLEVRDWGRGFRTSTLSSGPGPGERVGLPGMRERIALLGGKLTVRSRPGGGTRVVAEVPLPDLKTG